MSATKVRDVAAKVSKYVKDRPWAMVAIGMVAGTILSAMLRGKRKRPRRYCPNLDDVRILHG